MRILLIKPKWFHPGDGYKFRDFVYVPPLNLGIIAALSEGHEVKIIDEDMDPIEYSSDWDLVGITAATFTSTAAYAISDKFRQLGVKTVLGGVHPAFMPDECLEHADAIVVGEAEPVWRELLEDLEKNQLKKTYNGGYLENLDEVPFPRRDLFSDKYYTAPVQITRGCENSCRYCYLQSVPWKKWRKRNNLDRVVEEISMIKQKYLFIIDDNLCIEPEYAKQVFDRIAPLKKRWGMQASTLIAKDEEMLEKMANAGCFNVTLGLQSINEKTVDEGKFFHNRVEEYRNIIEKINSYGIVVQAFFMFGFDNDDKNIFRDTMRAIRELNIDDVIMYILTPYPGTDYFAEFEADNRILTYDWSKYSWWNCVYKPKNMTETELEEGLRWAYGELNKDCRKRLPSRIWKYRKLFFDDLAITGRLIKGYIHNKVDPQKMP